MPLDPQAARVLAAIEQSNLPLPETLPPEQARTQYEQTAPLAAGQPPALFDIRDTEAEGPLGAIPLRVYTPRDPAGATLPVLVYLHGGGFVLGSIETHDAPCRHLALNGDCIVVSVDYRMAPEYPFPEPVEDCWAALEWIVANAPALGGDARRIAIGGDSAGANIATVLCRRAVERGTPRLVYQLLIYPVTDFTRSHPSHQELATGYRLTESLMDWFVEQYFSGRTTDKRDPMASPLLCQNLSGLPPALVVTAGYDPLRDEGIAYHQALLEQGVASEHLHYPGMIHGFINMFGLIDQTGECLQACGQHLKAGFGNAKKAE